MNPPRPDPRLFEHNFAMPMNPASAGESEVGDVRRKDGAPVPAAIPPGYGDEVSLPSTIRRRDKNETPPLFCTLYRKADGTRTVTVSEGSVIEFIPKSATADVPPVAVDGVKEWPIDNIWKKAPDPTNLLEEHAIQTGWSIGVLFSVDKAGYIFEEAENKVRIATRDHTLEAGDISVHYDPPVGPSPGAAGTVYVILARLIGTGDAERLHVYHGGSNVEHYHELSPFRLVDNAAGKDIMDDFDAVTGEYRYLGVRGKNLNEKIDGKPADTDPKIEILEQLVGGLRTDLVADWTKGPNLNLIVKTYTLEATTVEVPISITIPARTVTTAYDGAHAHGHIDYLSEGYQVTTGQTGAWSLTPEGYPVRGGDDGTHAHTVTIPAETVTTTISVPGEPTKVIDTDYYTVCFRDRLYHSVVANAGALPEPKAGTVTQTKTIWILNMDNGLDLGSETTPNVAII